MTIGTSNLKNREIWLREVLDTLPNGARILDAGAGELQYKKYCRHLEYISQDFAQYDGKGDGSALQTGQWERDNIDIISDITEIPVHDCSFDAVMCVEVLEHVPDPILAIKELSRILKKDGLLIMTVPFASLTHFSPYHYYSGFNKYFFYYHLPKLSLRLESIVKNGNYFEYIAQEMYRLPNMSNLYSNTKFSIVDKIASRIILKKLKQLSKKDNGSNEMLYYGLHILARRI